ncbi:hypothetical protein R3P38DRAFT_2790984 [Favolaschia claudopus]|uniref:Uncharacterized protein n=1 Tax=Favolaschia claudopus TaxID=2862362 RepID=A0AAW0AHQ4_9AGAR
MSVQNRAYEVRGFAYNPIQNAYQKWLKTGKNRAYGRARFWAIWIGHITAYAEGPTVTEWVREEKLSLRYAIIRLINPSPDDDEARVPVYGGDNITRYAKLGNPANAEAS